MFSCIVFCLFCVSMYVLLYRCTRDVVIVSPHLLPDGLPTRQLGPVNVWWIAGFDGGEKALVGFTTGWSKRHHPLLSSSLSSSPHSSISLPFSLLSLFVFYLLYCTPTAYAEYFLMEPSEMYAPIMATVHEKIYLSKVSRSRLQTRSCDSHMTSGGDRILRAESRRDV